ncbi:MAG: DNA gyrase inhibitor YacG [Pseudomonadota bacterium]
MSRCPVCKETSEKDWRPFCSKRCADIDLGRWMTGAYAVPVEEDPEDSRHDAAPPTH